MADRLTWSRSHAGYLARCGEDAVMRALGAEG